MRAPGWSSVSDTLLRFVGVNKVSVSDIGVSVSQANGRDRVLPPIAISGLTLGLLMVQYVLPATCNPSCLNMPGVGSVGEPLRKVRGGRTTSEGRRVRSTGDESIWDSLLSVVLLILMMVIWSATPLWERMRQRIRTWWSSFRW